MARIEESKRTYIEELATNPRVNLMVLSERINIAFHEDESEVYLYRYSINSDNEPVLENIESDEEYEIVSDAFDEELDAMEYEELYAQEDS